MGNAAGNLPAMHLDPVGVEKSPIIDIQPYSKSYLQEENLRMPAWMAQIHRELETEYKEIGMNAQQIMERDDFKRCEAFHGHVCGGLAIGYVAANAGLAWLEEQRALDEEMVAIVETDACCVDAIQVLTGCTFGKGNLIYKDHGKVGFTFFNRRTGKGVRLALKPDTFRVNDRQIELFKKTRDGGISEAEKEELAALGSQRTAEVLNTRAEDLFNMTPVTAGMPDKARIEPSQPCSRCGEPTMVSKLESVDGDPLCRGCLG